MSSVFDEFSFPMKMVVMDPCFVDGTAFNSTKGHGVKNILKVKGVRMSLSSKDISMRLMPVQMEQSWSLVIQLDGNCLVKGWLSREEAGMSEW